MSRREIDRKFDEIVAFAEIEQFLDTPVKRYSSGMYVRLAFAVAAHLEPEILIVDEVLAVGDARFQKKCLGKMDAVTHQGRTVLLVSHQMQVIQAITRRSILLESGQVRKIGRTADVVSTYLGSSRHHTDLSRFQQSGSGEVQLLELRVTTDSSDSPGEIVRGENLRIELSLLVQKELPEANFSMAIRNTDGLELFSHAWSDQYTQLLTMLPGRHRIGLNVPTRHLRPGLHWLSLCVSKYEADLVVDVQGVELPPVVLESRANAVMESRAGAWCTSIVSGTINGKTRSSAINTMIDCYTFYRRAPQNQGLQRDRCAAATGASLDGAAGAAFIHLRLEGLLQARALPPSLRLQGLLSERRGWAGAAHLRCPGPHQQILCGVRQRRGV